MAGPFSKIDDFVRDYLLFRGLNSTLKSYDNELKTDRDKAFRADKIIELFHSYVNNFELVNLKDYWNYLDTRIFSRLEQAYSVCVRKLEVSLYRWYLVTAVSCGRSDKVNEFFEKMTPEIQTQSEWREWFALPFIKNPEENVNFAMYFTKNWQDSYLLSLHNFLNVSFQKMPLPALLMYESDQLHLRRLQEERDFYKQQLLSIAEKKNVEAKFVQADRNQPILENNMELMDDFYDITQNTSERAPLSEESQAKGIIRSFAKKISLPTSPKFIKPQNKGPQQNIQQKEEPKSKPPKDNNTTDMVKIRIKPSTSVPVSASTTPVRTVNQQKHVSTGAMINSANRQKVQEDFERQRNELLGIKPREKGNEENIKRKSFEPSKKDVSLAPVNSPNPPSSPVMQSKSEHKPLSVADAPTPSEVADSSQFLLLSQEEYAEHHSSITHCRFSETGKMVASVDIDGVVKVWSLDPSPVTVGSIVSSNPLLSLEWASKADRLLLLGNKAGKIRLFDIKEKKTLIEVTADSTYPRISTLCCSPSGSMFVCASSGRGRQTSSGAESGPRLGRLTLWDMKTMKMDKELPQAVSPIAVNCMAFNHNGQLLITGGADGMLRIFDMQGIECIATWGAHIGEVHSVQFSSDETTCYSMGSDGKFYQWSVHKTGFKIADLNIHSGAAGPFVLSAYGGYRQMQTPKGKLFAFDAEGNHVLTCSQGGGIIYRLNTSNGAEKSLSLGGHRAPTVTVDWSTHIDCRTCLTGSMDGKVVVSTLLSQK